MAIQIFPVKNCPEEEEEEDKGIPAAVQPGPSQDIMKAFRFGIWAHTRDLGIMCTSASHCTSKSPILSNWTLKLAPLEGLP